MKTFRVHFYSLFPASIYHCIQVQESNRMYINVGKTKVVVADGLVQRLRGIGLHLTDRGQVERSHGVARIVQQRSPDDSKALVLLEFPTGANYLGCEATGLEGDEIVAGAFDEEAVLLELRQQQEVRLKLRFRRREHKEVPVTGFFSWLRWFGCGTTMDWVAEEQSDVQYIYVKSDHIVSYTDETRVDHFG
jgi:hypothetical protein